ncbi:MAG: sigma-54-dependent Fis family transcriptional regulator, partial [Candidatus Aminicenantes bacterium]|nr:sigma-54-dependent Fis family transcriptional regulator [Candidatus Aminicenantes bacterium]
YPPELITLLSTYYFNGNIRELQAFIYDAVSRHISGVLSLQSFKDVIEEGRETTDLIDSDEDINSTDISGFFNQFPTLKEAETFLIEKALEQAKGNQGIAASILGISRQALNKRLIRKKTDQ